MACGNDWGSMPVAARGALEGRADLFDLATTLGRTEVDGRTHGDAPHVEGLVDLGEQGLIVSPDRSTSRCGST